MQASDDADLALVLGAARARLDEAGVLALRTALARPGLDLHRAGALARHHGLAPLLIHHALAHGRDLLPVEVSERWKAFAAQNALRNLHTVAQLHDLLGLLQRGGIEAVPYKGPALAALLYGNLALREYVDLDVLVQPADAARACGLLAAEGFVPHFALGPARLRAHVRLSYVQLFERPGHAAVELHWNVAPRFFSLPVDVAALWSRLRPLPLGGRPVLAPAAEDLMLLLAAHGAKDGWQRLEWVAAIAEVARDPSLDWGRALAEARRIGGLRLVRVALALARALCAAPLPGPVAAGLEDDAAARRIASDLEQRLRRADPFAPAAEEGFLARAALHLSLREHLADRARYCVRVLFTTTADDWAAAPLPERLSFLHPAVRAARLLGKYLLGRGRPPPQPQGPGG